MPQYYFHICDSLGVIADDEGMPLADLHAARAEANMSMLEIVKRRIAAKQAIQNLSIEIADGAGSLLDCIYADPQ